MREPPKICFNAGAAAPPAADFKVAERELSAFIGAITELFGPAQARLSAEDWLDEARRMDVSPKFTQRDWRRVTMAASAHLARRVVPDSVRTDATNSHTRGGNHV